MPAVTNIFPGADYAVPRFRQAVERAMKSLLETSFLYQKITVQLPAIIDGHPKTKEFQSAYMKLEYSTWRFVARGDGTKAVRNESPKDIAQEPVCVLPSICRSCTHCDAEKPVHTPGVYGSPCRGPVSDLAVPEAIEEFGDVTQIWTFAYQCQHCTGEPLLVMVRREGMKLQLVGRSFSDLGPTPASVPENVKRYFREAEIAHGAGKHLPAILYLRLVIEHHMRAVAGVESRIRGDELAEAYAKRVPPKIKDNEVSLKTVYSDLSAAVHSGEEDGALYAKMREVILRHFTLLKLYPIPPLPPPPEESSPSPQGAAAAADVASPSPQPPAQAR